MAYKYTHFIPQNIAPKGAKEIGVYSESGEKICTIPLGNIAPITKEKLYSFGIVSDCHTASWTTNFNGNGKLRNALAYFKGVGCSFVIGCGDFTQAGFYYADASDYDESQMLAYKAILDSYDIPVYEIFGNHENYYGVSITNHLERAKELTGIPYTAYTVSSSADSDGVVGSTARPNRQATTIGNDLFILVGQSEGSKPMSNDDLTWLENTLEANRDRRCFVFIHSFIDDNWGSTSERDAEDTDGYIISDSGNPCGARGNAIVGWWEDYDKPTLNKFLTTMSNAKNAVLFHGHSHMKFESQEMDECANYTEKNGFKSVHVPSCGSPRTLLDSDGNWTTNKGADGYAEPDSQGYIVDVYDDCIVLNGWDFVGNAPVVLGCYKIDCPSGVIESATSNFTLSDESVLITKDGKVFKTQ